MNDLATQLDRLREKLSSTRRPPKPKMLVVDDEPDNLDLLYRTFRREFNVLKAESGKEALDILAREGEVAVIVSDQRMPEMKGTEFLSRTVPDFPDTVRIILTGFTDVEDLVDAINSGQVYKYITKPWDPDELKVVVQRASDSYSTTKERSLSIDRAQAQSKLLATILQTVNTAADLATGLSAIAEALADRFQADVCWLQPVANGSLTEPAASYVYEGTSENWLADDPLVAEAIASHAIQLSANIPADAKLSTLVHYGSSGIQSHVVLPALHRGAVTALVSLQWRHPSEFAEMEIEHLYLATQQISLALLSLA